MADPYWAARFMNRFNFSFSPEVELIIAGFRQARKPASITSGRRLSMARGVETASWTVLTSQTMVSVGRSQAVPTF